MAKAVQVQVLSRAPQRQSSLARRNVTMRVLFFTIVMLTVALFSSGCTSLSPDQKPEPKPALRAMGESIKPGEVVGNEDIGFAIRRRLNENPAETAGIIIEVDDGKVILRGAAPNLPASWRAEAAARSVKGVKEVSNQIIVPATSQH
jgi:hypothetical protein